MSAEEKKLTADGLLQSILLDAQHKALLSLVLSIAEHLHLRSEEGLTPEAWYQQRIRLFLEKHVLLIGDSNPAAAVEIQKLIDGINLP